MGCSHFPTTLQGWALYCDCLQSTSAFKSKEESSSEPSHLSQSEVNEKQIAIKPSPPNKQQNQSQSQDHQQELQTPSPAKVNKHYHKPRTKPVGSLIFKTLEKQDTIDQISDLSEVKPRKDNVFDLNNLDEDEEVNNNRFTSLYRPIISYQERRARATAPIMKYLHAQRQSSKGEEDFVTEEKDAKIGHFMNAAQQEEFTSKLN